MHDCIMENNISSTFNPTISTFLHLKNTSADFLFHGNESESYLDLSSSELTLENQFSSEFEKKLGTYLYKLYIKQKSVKLYEVPWGIILLLYALYGLISVMSLLGNGMVVWVLTVSKEMRTVTNMFIGNMAVADILIGIFVVPFQFQVALLEPWYLPDFMCAFSPFFQVLSVNLSVFSLCAIALDRYRAVLHPLSARISKQRSILIISVIWTISVLLALPTYYDYKLIIIRKLFTAPHSLCLNVKLSPQHRLLYNLGLFVVQYLIPLYTICVAYSRMAVRLWGRVIPGNVEHSRDAIVQKGKIKVIKTLALVVILFGVCWLPLQLYNVVQYIYPALNNYSYINIIWFCIHWLAMSNSCLNPFIYAVYNDKFQDEIIIRLGSCKNICCLFVKKASVITALQGNLPIAASIAAESDFMSRFRLEQLVEKQRKSCLQKTENQGTLSTTGDEAISKSGNPEENRKSFDEAGMNKSANIYKPELRLHNLSDP